MNQLKELHGEVFLGLNITATWVDEDLCERGVSRARRLSGGSDCSPRRTPITTPNGHGHRSSVGAIGFFAPRTFSTSPLKSPVYLATSPTPSQGSRKSENEDPEKDAEAEKDLEKEELTKSECKTIFIGNVSFRATRYDLTKFFSKFGEVMKCYIVEDHVTRKSKGIAFLTFASEDVVKKILSASQDELYFQHRYLRVHLAEEKKREKVARQKEPVTIRVSSPEVVEAEIWKDSPVMTLNDDVLIIIFSHLSVRDKIMVERVCKRWRRVMMQSWALLDSLHLRNLVQRWFSGVTDTNLKTILVRCPNLKNIDLSANCRHLTDWSLEIIAQHCPKLVTLDLSGMSVTNSSLKTLSNTCKDLQSIKLTRCFDAGEKGLWWLFKNCTNLNYVNLEEDSKVTGNCFHVIGSKVQKLILNKCGKLEDVAFEKLAKNCGSSLEELQINECNSITDDGLQKLTEGLPNLRFLCASSMYKVNAFGLSKIGALKNLTHLYVSHNTGVSDSVLYRISQGCIQLRVLDLAGCHQVTDAGLQCVSNCSKLYFLNISYLHQVQDESLQLLATNCDLQTLTAQACSEISNTGVRVIATECRSLTDLDLSGCYKVNNETLEVLLEATKEEGRPKLTATIGGTSIDPSQFDLHDNLEISIDDFSKNFLRADGQLVLPGGDDFSDDEFEHDGEEVDDHVIAAGMEEQFGFEDDFEDFAINDMDDFLDNDDPLHQEQFELS